MVRHTRGVLASLFQPTRVEHHMPDMPGVLSVWSARRHRKGRYPTIVSYRGDRTPVVVKHVRARSLLAPFGFKLIGWEPGNTSYWTAMFFTIGSIIWVVNGCFLMWPLHSEALTAKLVAWTAFAGGFSFLIGSYFGVLEVLNDPSQVSLGHEVRHEVEHVVVLHHNQGGSQKEDSGSARAGGRMHVHPLKASRPADLGQRRGFAAENGVEGVGGRDPADLENARSGLSSSSVGPRGVNGSASTNAANGGGDTFGGSGDSTHGEGLGSGSAVDGSLPVHSPSSGKPRRWRWVGIEPRSFSYWTAMSQMMGAIVFGIAACITGVPNVLPSDYDRHWQIWDALYWTPQCIGAVFFIINSFMVAAESQHAWVGFHPLNMGWEVAFWNCVGAVGFFLSGAFGYKEYPNPCCQYWGTAFSSFWGSICFLISSYLLLVEMLNK
eukprot:jgi/Mesen1/5707/ME000288S04915